MQYHPRLHSFAIRLVNIVIARRDLGLAGIHHLLDRASDDRQERESRKSQNGPVAVPLGNLCRLELAVAGQPTPGERAGDGAGEAAGDDDRVAEFHVRLPVARERASGVLLGGLQEGVEDRVLEQRQADRGGGGAEGEDEAEVAWFWLEWCHCGCVWSPGGEV